MIQKWALFIVLLLISERCCKEVGYLYPNHNIVSKANSTVALFCILYQADETTNSNLLSFNSNRGYNYQNYVKILNETTIKLTLRNVQPMDDNIWCAMSGTGVGLRTITIGTPPEEVKKFSCVSYDFKYMLCQFEIPHNFVMTKYNLYEVDKKLYNCTLNESTRKMQCNLTLEELTYRPRYDIYNFTLISNNSLGPARSDNYIISNFDSAIPGNPNLTITSRTTNSAVLEWSMDFLFTKKGILYVVKYVSHFNKYNWVTLKNDFQNSTKNSVEITDLKPYTKYTVQLDMKSFNAADSDLYWKKTNKTFQTKPAKPNDPPKVDIGSFEKKYHSNSTIRTCNIYWSRVPETEYNGPNIDERVKEVRRNQKIINVNYINKTDYSAIYELDKADYEFTIHTVNNEGESVNGSVLHVSNEDYPAPRFLKKIWNDPDYDIMWSEPEQNNNSNLMLIDYTLFQCKARTETSEECKNGFEFRRVDKHERNQSIPSKDQMNFAVSANYYHNVSGFVSSGMVWAQCTASANSDLVQVNLIDFQSLNGSTIRLGWKLDCVPSTVVKGFRLKFCPLYFKNSRCAETEKTLNISSEKLNYILNDLKSYTTYRIRMNMYSETKEGPFNIHPKEVTTLESKPSRPRRLQVIGKTDSSFTLKWEAPKSMNGKLRFYTINYNEKTVNTDDDHLANKSVIEYKLENLTSYKNYTITVTARTKEESERSNDCVNTTKVGYPGAPESALHQSTLNWNAPNLLAGPGIAYYEVKTEISDGNATLIKSIISRIRGQLCTMEDEPCNNGSLTFKYFVRAVNVINKENITNTKTAEEINEGVCKEETDEFSKWYNNNKDTKTFLEGAWSTPLSSGCSPPYGVQAYIPVLIGLGALFTVIISYFASKKYVQMKDIRIEFPPGLTDLNEESHPKGFDETNTDDMAHLLKSVRYVTNFSDINSNPTKYDVSHTFVVHDEDCSNVEISNMSDTLNSSPIDSPNMNLRQMPNQSPPQSNPAVSPVIVNGYVQHKPLPTNPLLNGYIQMDASRNSLMPSKQKDPLNLNCDYVQMDASRNSIIPSNLTTMDSSKLKDPSGLNCGAQENISGYVTQEQLSMFGLSQQ